MPLSWNEIKQRAIKFSNEWKDASNESADAKPFLIEFFNVFGISSRKVSTFEHRVKKLDETDGYIDLLWKGTILVEMKSRGKNLDRAYQQAKDYIDGLKEYEIPKYVLISDFENFRLFDLEEQKNVEFNLNKLVYNVQHFGYLIGLEKKEYKEQDPANIKAAELMGRLHDRLKEIGYEGHPLEVYLVRLLFCLFAEDTTIFNKQQFQDFIEQRTGEDGSDLAAKLQELFQVLNTAQEHRFKNIDEQLAEFPYVNGKLFEESLPTASFDSKMRQALLDCCHINWSKISPAIFGSMFQSVMNPTERRNLGAHYTSEKNILKVIKPLFLDHLWKEFELVKDSKNKLEEFHNKLSKLKFLDPACGCGNFLVITYRELRLLEIEIIKTILFKHYKIKKEVAADAQININQMVKIEVDQFYGIEIEEFPARIAEVAMWLIDHQMNMLLSEEFGKYFIRLPLKKAAKIQNVNALQIDWETIIPKTQLTFILGNPPYIGKNFQTEVQKLDLANIYNFRKGIKNIDYVSGWYVKAARYIQDTTIKVAFVSTNSITQGEQVGLLWPVLFYDYKIKIHFAYRTFKWSNEAKGNAGVHVVIIGFANFDSEIKYLYEFENVNGQPHQVKVKNISSYLVEGKDISLLPRSHPICNVPEMINGSKAVDGGNLLFTEEEKNEFLLKEPKASKYFREFIGSDEYINNFKRYCLWLKNIEPFELRDLKYIKEKVEAVKSFRIKSTKATTRKAALTPSLFGEIRQPSTNYLLIPRVSSENRIYIPIGYLSPDIIISDRATALPQASLYTFAVITSIIHMTWMKYTCGRLESRYNYSNSIVYNNFPWPLNPTDKQIKTVEEKAQKVLDVRKEFPNSSLADLYDPLTMPPALVKAHQALDKAVDLCYRPQPFPNETKRIEFLFELYEKYTQPLMTKTKKK